MARGSLGSVLCGKIKAGGFSYLTMPVFNNQNAIDFVDSKGKRTIWPKEKFEEHASRREILKNGGLDSRIEKAKNFPCIIIKSPKGRNRLCYYYLEYESSGRRRYTKIIIEKARQLDIIKTAYRPDKIIELEYFKPIWVKPGFQPK